MKGRKEGRKAGPNKTITFKISFLKGFTKSS